MRESIAKLLTAEWVDEMRFQRITEPDAQIAESELRYLEMMRTPLDPDSPSGWIEPAITNDYDGSVLIEWNKGQRSLSLFVKDGEISALVAWGYHADMKDGMEEFDSVDRQWIGTHYDWLVRGRPVNCWTPSHEFFKEIGRLVADEDAKEA